MKKKLFCMALMVMVLLISSAPQQTMAATSNWHNSSNTATLDVYTGKSNWVDINTQFQVSNSGSLYVDVYRWDEKGNYIPVSKDLIIRNNEKIILYNLNTRYQFVVRANGNSCEWRIKGTSTSVTRIEG